MLRGRPPAGGTPSPAGSRPLPLARREDVDDAAAPRELPPPPDLGYVLVAEADELLDQAALGESDRRAQEQRTLRQVAGGDRVLEERLHRGHEDARAARILSLGAILSAPRCEGGDSGCSLVPDELAALVGQRGARLQDDDLRRVAEPGLQLLDGAVGGFRVAGDPQEPLPRGLGQGGRERRLRAQGYRGVRDVAQPLPHSPGSAGCCCPEPLRQRAELAAPREKRHKSRDVDRRAVPLRGPRVSDGMPALDHGTSHAMTRPSSAAPGSTDRSLSTTFSSTAPLASGIRPDGARFSSYARVARSTRSPLAAADPVACMVRAA